jgi:hypothetical protein
MEGGRLALTDVVAQIDAEIAKLQQARALLGGSTVAAAKRGRPAGSKNAAKAAAPAAKKKRRLSAAGRKAIGDAMRRRWAEKRKAAAK